MTLSYIRRSSALVAVLACLVAGSSLAQTASFDDLRALRYYVQQGDDAATRAELRRLRAAYPDWRPPADLNTLLAPQTNASVDEGAIWQLIERRDYDGARRQIDAGRQAVAGWTPPADMLRTLETNSAQDAFDRATAARNASDAIAIARRAPQIMSCERINNAWLLADMYVLAGQNAAAVTTYRNTVQSCTGFAQMQPTLEKASAIASPTDLSAMFDTARSANRAETERLNALQRRLLGGGAPAPQVAAAPRPQAPAPQPSQLSAPQPAAAAPVSNPSSVPLRGDSRLADVRRLKEQEQFARCIAASTNPRSLEVLYERSWCLYSHERPTEALVGFQAAAGVGDAIGPNVGRDAHYGMALSYLSMNMTEQGAQIASRVRLTDTQRAEVEGIVLDQRGVKAYRNGNYRQAIAYFDALTDLKGGLRRDLSILRAYALLNSGQRVAAREEFERLHAQLATAETRQGLSAALGN
jgi:tetratricopeptide (TPR) repeat protein